MNALFSYQSPEWKALRVQALVRAGYRCQNCRTSVAGFKRSRVDHIVPVSENPNLAFALSNLRVLCPRCDNARHSEKGNRTVERQQVGLDGFPE